MIAQILRTAFEGLRSTPPRRLIVVGVLLAVCVSRVAARQASIWEWDDVIFCVSLNVFAPHMGTPQAPFYPGFVALGRLAKAAFGDEVLALTWLSVLASCLAVCALYLLVQEWLGRWREALAAAVIFAFLPAVWFHGGGPLSDPAGLAAALMCAWLAVRTRRTPSLAPLAALAFGVAVSIRPQAALIALAPLAHTLLRLCRRRRMIATVVLLAGVVGLYFVPVLVAGGGIAGPLRAFRYQTGFVMGADSLAAPGRSIGAVLRKYLVEIWLVWPFAAFVGSLVVYGALVLARKRRGVLVEVAGSFLPYAVACWAFLDPTVGGRYGLPFLPGVAVLMAVAATDLENRVLPRKLPLITGVAVLWPAAMMWPAIRVIHTRASPPVAAAHAIRQDADGRDFGVVFGPGLFPHATWLFPDVAKVADIAAIGRSADSVGVRRWWRFGVAEEGDATAASWPPLAAFNRIGRGRYLTVPFGRLSHLPVVFAGGWYGAEGAIGADGRKSEFRWMAERGVLSLPRLGATLRLEMEVRAPLDALPEAPEVKVLVDGREVDRFAATSAFVPRRYLLPPEAPRGGAVPRWVEITTNETVIPTHIDPRLADTRVLGLQVANVKLSIE